MSAPYCQNCSFWEAGGAKMALVRTNPNPQDGIGICKLMPPLPVALGPGLVEAAYPETREDDRCGAWEENLPVPVLSIGADGGSVVLEFPRPAP